MKQTTKDALLQVYDQLQDLAGYLYAEARKALDNKDYSDASVLESRADKIYEESEAIDIFLIEMEET